MPRPCGVVSLLAPLVTTASNCPDGTTTGDAVFSTAPDRRGLGSSPAAGVGIPAAVHVRVVRGSRCQPRADRSRVRVRDQRDVHVAEGLVRRQLRQRGRSRARLRSKAGRDDDGSRGCPATCVPPCQRRRLLCRSERYRTPGRQYDCVRKSRWIARRDERLQPLCGGRVPRPDRGVGVDDPVDDLDGCRCRRDSRCSCVARRCRCLHQSPQSGCPYRRCH